MNATAKQDASAKSFERCAVSRAAAEHAVIAGLHVQFGHLPAHGCDGVAQRNAVEAGVTADLRCRL